jgi:hypothetical protein
MMVRGLYAAGHDMLLTSLPRQGRDASSWNVLNYQFATQ